jgi:DUF4097 and DUF4098 domain-containing protein YvlB
VKRQSADKDCGNGRGGLGKFIETLFAGIPWSERAEQTETIHLPRPPGGNLRIDNANGRTRIVGEDRGDIEIQLCKAARAESEEQARHLLDAIRVVSTEDTAGDMSLEVEIPGRWNRRGRVDLELHIPRELKVEVAAANGKICVQGLRGSVRARSSNGAVRIEDVIGDVEIHTSNAKVVTLCTCGHVAARSSNGKIELEDHRGSVDAATSNGTIHCEIEDIGKSGIILSTSNGRIVLDLPEDANGDVDVRVDNGLIRNSRELDPPSREHSGRMKGTLGRGGAPIRLRASNGTISIR